MTKITFTEENRNKQTIMFDDIKVARIHYRKADAMLYVYRSCKLADAKTLKTNDVKRLKKATFMNDEKSNIIAKIEVNSTDKDVIADTLLKSCTYAQAERRSFKKDEKSKKVDASSKKVDKTSEKKVSDKTIEKKPAEPKETELSK